MPFGLARLRPPPQMRFAPPAEVVDLRAQARQLLREPDAGQHGHRQMALFKHGPATLALYHFEAGARLPDHVVDGPVILHVLEGELWITTDRDEHVLPAGTLLRLAPGVRHDVTATQGSLVLWTVCVEGPESHGV